MIRQSKPQKSVRSYLLHYSLAGARTPFATLFTSFLQEKKSIFLSQTKPATYVDFFFI